MSIERIDALRRELGDLHNYAQSFGVTTNVQHKMAKIQRDMAEAIEEIGFGSETSGPNVLKVFEADGKVEHEHVPIEQFYAKPYVDELPKDFINFYQFQTEEKPYVPTQKRKLVLKRKRWWETGKGAPKWGNAIERPNDKPLTHEEVEVAMRKYRFLVGPEKKTVHICYAQDFIGAAMPDSSPYANGSSYRF